jgi:hypothetical protein
MILHPAPVEDPALVEGPATRTLFAEPDVNTYKLVEDQLFLNLQGATFAPIPKKRGRPKGAVTSAIGLPHKWQKFEKRVPFHKKTPK